MVVVKRGVGIFVKILNSVLWSSTTTLNRNIVREENDFNSTYLFDENVVSRRYRSSITTAAYTKKNKYNNGGFICFKNV